jgi:hypothetical protein
MTFKDPIPKRFLQVEAYYVGNCRNAQIARWDGTQFKHWRLKFGHQFIETIKHREDDEVFDVFDAYRRVENEWAVREIPLGEPV